MAAQIKSWKNGQKVKFSKELLDSIDVHIDKSLDVKIKDER